MTTPAIPPHDEGAEESLLGAMLLSGPAIDIAGESVTSDAFYVPAHGLIFNAIVALHERGAPADATTVLDELKRAGHVEAIGGSSRLLRLITVSPSPAHAGRYARIVAEHALMRRMVDVGRGIAADAMSAPKDIEAAIDVAEGRLFGLRRSDSATVASLSDSLRSWWDELDDRRTAGARPEISTGWPALDDVLGGLRRQRLVVVAARPGMGKTSWAGALALNVAKNQLPVLFVSLEMSRDELVSRFVAHESGIHGDRLLRGTVTARDDAHLNRATTTLTELPIDVADIPTATLFAIRAEVRRRLAARGRLGLVVVDYLQLMHSSGRPESRQAEVAAFARGLKVLARELDVPVVALAQLNRALESRADKRPMLSDLRESGEIENAADAVVFIHRPNYFEATTAAAGEAELIVAKNRHGTRDTVRLLADLSTGRWSDYGSNIAQIGGAA